MFCILGLLPENETQDYQLTNLTTHAELRKFRMNLIVSTNVLYYFEVYRFKDQSRQVHCLLEDGSIVIFNKLTKKVITVILADQDLLYKYINKYGLEERDKTVVLRCGGLNKKYKANDKELEEEISKDYKRRKDNIINS